MSELFFVLGSLFDFGSHNDGKGNPIGCFFLMGLVLLLAAFSLFYQFFEPEKPRHRNVKPAIVRVESKGIAERLGRGTKSAAKGFFKGLFSKEEK